jgi:DNA-binding transcriptional LysR family regulator
MEHLMAMAYFARVVDCGGFSAAALRLGVSKSTVSKEISSLEDHLGVRLLQRTTRSFALTEAGQAFYVRCLRMLAEADAAEQEAMRGAASPRGRLRVTAPMTYAARRLAPLVCAFARQWPDVDVEMSLDDRFVDLVQDGFDVGIRIAHLADSSMVARKLSAAPKWLIASPEYLASRGTPQHPEDLAQHDGLLYTLLSAPEQWTFRGGDTETTVRVAGRMRSNNGEVLKEAALAGLGLAVLPDFFVEDEVRTGRLRVVLPGWTDHRASVWAVYPNARHLAPGVRAFVDFLVEALSNTR